MPTSHELTTTLRCIPQTLVEATAEALLYANARAKAQLADLPALPRRDTFGQLQRARFETKWVELASRIEGVTASFKQNGPGTSAYAEIRVGDHLVLTQAAVTHRGALPRPADYRKNLSAQLEMFAKNNDPTTVYALVVHAHDKEQETYYLAVVVPNAKCSAALARVPLDEALEAARVDSIEREEMASDERIAEPMPGELRPAVIEQDDKAAATGA